MSKVAFMTQTLRQLRHIPPTQLGFFDVEYTPSNSKLKITVKFSINKFIGGGFKAVWSDLDKSAFLNSFQNRINEYWNDKFVIQCVKPGWENIIAKPEFALTQAASAFHYSIKIAGSGGTSNTAVRTYQTDHNRQQNPNIGHATAIFGAQATDRFANAEGQNRNILSALRMPLDIPIGTAQTGGQISFAAMSLMQTFAENNNYVFSAAAAKPTIKITSVGSKTTKDADRVMQVLRTYGVTNPMKSKSGVRMLGTSAPKGNRVVRIEWDNLQAFDAAIPQDPTSIPLASQATIAHEYGHMLGLPDEYNVLCSQSTDFWAENKLLRNGTEGAVHLGNNPENSQAAQSATIAENQKQFMRLCSEAGLVPPPFGRPNYCIMSGGSVFKPYHCVTVWDALCQLTESQGLTRKDWRIEMA